MGFSARHLKPRIEGFLLIAIFLLAKAAFATAENPLTEDQIRQLSVGPLRPYPDEIVKLVERHGVNFVPTNGTVRKLKDAGVDQSVIFAIWRKAGSQLRIKVCRFESTDSTMATNFANAMVHSVVIVKGALIDPFGRIPLDRSVCPPEGFSKDVNAEPNTHYFLLEGWIKKSGSGFSLDLKVIYQDPEGKQYPLPGAEKPPAAFNEQTLDRIASEVVNWGIQTMKDYATRE